ncbi:hypothetical protein R6Q59_016420 [Mikania micrantha]
MAMEFTVMVKWLWNSQCRVLMWRLRQRMWLWRVGEMKAVEGWREMKTWRGECSPRRRGGGGGGRRQEAESGEGRKAVED